jgi:hypothetical protein
MGRVDEEEAVVRVDYGGTERLFEAQIGGGGVDYRRGEDSLHIVERTASQWSMGGLVDTRLDSLERLNRDKCGTVKV